ncbi:MAG: YceI family protein [Aquisalimonadaceae bacterium]
MHRWLTCCLCLLLNIPAAADWVVIPSDSRLEVAGFVEGERVAVPFQRFSADIQLAADAPSQGRITVHVETASLITESAEANALLRGRRWFHVSEYPEAVFRTSSISAGNGGTLELHGELTLRGVTRPVTIPAELAIDGDSLRLTGGTTINRTEFDVGSGAWARDTIVGHTVGISFDLNAEPAQ